MASELRSAPWVAIALTAVTSSTVVLAVFFSSYGSLLFMDDGFDRTKLLAPVLAGVLTGLLESLAFENRVVLGTVGALAFVAVFSIVGLYPFVTHFAGVVIGCVLVSAGRRVGLVRRSRLATVGALTAVIALATAAVIYTFLQLGRLDLAPQLVEASAYDELVSSPLLM